MVIRLSALRSIYEPGQTSLYNGPCSRLVNELIGEPLFLALCAECLSSCTESEWHFSHGEARGLMEGQKRSTRKWLDGFLFGSDPLGRIPSPLACEVKGWSDNSLGGYNSEPPKRAKTLKLPRGQFYWRVVPDCLRRDGALAKLDVKWQPPSCYPADAECAVGAIFYHFIEPPVDDPRVTWPFSSTRSVFWFDTRDRFDVHRRVLVFSVAKYVEERSAISDEFELVDAGVDAKMECLRLLGVLGNES